MLWLNYGIFNVFLYLWTISSVTFYPETYQLYQLGIYIVSAVLLILFTFFVCKIDRDGKLDPGMLIVSMLLHIGLSVNYQCAKSTEDVVTFLTVVKNSCLPGLMMMFFAFFLVFTVVRFMTVHRSAALNRLAILAVPVCVFGAKFFRSVNGSNLTFCGFMVFAVVLMLYPFATAYCCSLNDDHYVGGKPTKISYNSLAFLFWNFLIYAGCVLDNEFGLLLVVALTSSVLFFLRSKDLLAKVVYTVASLAGALVAAQTVRHISNRLQIFLDPVAANSDPSLKEQAGSMLYLFRHLQEIGWYGNGIGHLSSNYFPTRKTDHLLVLAFDNFGGLIVLGIIIVGVILIRWMLTEPAGLSAYDRWLNKICALLVGLIMLLNVMSCTIITIGVPFPFSSNGNSINIGLMLLIAIHSALVGKDEKEEFNYADL